MRRGRRRPQRQLQQGRGTLRAESGFRLLLPAPRQRPVVREYRKTGAAAGAAGGAEARLTELEKPDVAGVLSSLRYLLADVIGDDDGAQPVPPDGLPDSAVADVSD